jgi:3D (Asp-Asp-Asp) domain-containing protein
MAKNSNIKPIEIISQEEGIRLHKKNISTVVNYKNKSVSRGKEYELIPIKVIVTAYAPYDNKSSICNDGESDHTSTGSRPNWGCIAADPKELPYGTKLIIKGYNNDKICTVQDTGGALRKDKNNIRIDLYMDTYEQAMNWGKREITVYIVKY